MLLVYDDSRSFQGNQGDRGAQVSGNSLRALPRHVTLFFVRRVHRENEGRRYNGTLEKGLEHKYVFQGDDGREGQRGFRGRPGVPGPSGMDALPCPHELLRNFDTMCTSCCKKP